MPQARKYRGGGGGGGGSVFQFDNDSNQEGGSVRGTRLVVVHDKYTTGPNF